MKRIFFLFFTLSVFLLSCGSSDESEGGDELTDGEEIDLLDEESVEDTTGMGTTIVASDTSMTGGSALDDTSNVVVVTETPNNVTNNTTTTTNNTSTKTNTTVNNTNTTKNNTTTTTKNTSTGGSKYYLIVGSTDKKSAANDLVKKLVKEGFKYAQVVDNPKGGYRIAAGVYSDKPGAQAQLNKLAAKYKKDKPWILLK